MKRSTPALFLDRLAARERTRRSNRQLGGILAFVAGAVNAGGFLAVARYTSHMTGVVSAIADDLVLGHATLFIGGLAMLASFPLGATTTALLANFGRLRIAWRVRAAPRPGGRAAACVPSRLRRQRGESSRPKKG